MNGKTDRTGGIGFITAGKTQQHLICISLQEAMEINPSLKFNYEIKNNNTLIFTFNQILGVKELAAVKSELLSELSIMLNQVIVSVINEIEIGGKLNRTVVSAVFK